MLTEKRVAILRGMADGMSNKQIAAATFKAHGTIRMQVSELLALLGARNRAHAVAIALRDGLIQ